MKDNSQEIVTPNVLDATGTDVRVEKLHYGVQSYEESKLRRKTFIDEMIQLCLKHRVLLQGFDSTFGYDQEYEFCECPIGNSGYHFSIETREMAGEICSALWGELNVTRGG